MWGESPYVEEVSLSEGNLPVWGVSLWGESPCVEGVSLCGESHDGWESLAGRGSLTGWGSLAAWVISIGHEAHHIFYINQFYTVLVLNFQLRHSARSGLI